MSDTKPQFTKRVQSALQIAKAEAQRLNHNYIGTEHLLLGLIKEEKGVAAQVLRDLNLDLSAIKQEIEATVGRGSRQPHGTPLLAPRAKEVIGLAAYIAAQLGHLYTGTEHLIIAILEEGNGMAAKILKQYVTREEVIGKVIEIFFAKGSERLFDEESLNRIRQTLTTIAPEPKWSLSSTTTDVLKLRRQRMVEQISAAAAQQERNRLARDLHDSIKQQLFSISAGAAAAQTHWESDPAGARQALADVQQNARAAMVEMDALLQQLSPTPLTTVGLVDAIRQQGEALEYRTGAKVSLALEQAQGAEQLPVGMQEMIFRITQEALSNVARHARAANVRIRCVLDEAEKRLVLEVIDDGQGFRIDEVKHGMGLTNLASRAESLKGQVEISSQVGQGTTIRVEIPVQAFLQ
ncbi:MAG: Clp protease N-terminal domain-containing protein [Caldilineaceae bacterium]